MRNTVRSNPPPRGKIMSVDLEAPLAPGSDRLRIGVWTVEPALNELSAASKSVKLEPKAMSVLMYLADRAGQVVGREALLAALWPGVVVGDDALTQVVIKLRKALGDTREMPAYIQTISKRGYRLIAPVVKSEMMPSAPIPDSAAPQVQRKQRAAWIAAAGIAVLLLAAAGVWWSDNERSRADLRSPAAIADTEATSDVQPTVTVRPFEVVGDDPQAALLARGIAADLITDLSKLSGLRVIDLVPLGGKASADTPASIPPIRYVVSGTVQRVDDRLRLHIYLTDGETGKQLWSERFDRAPSDLFAIQDELGPKVLQILPAKVSEAELRRVAQRHTRNLEAFEYFQRGQSALLVRQKAENETARDMFRRAIALDATFARAYAGLALTYAADYRNQWTGEGPAALDRALEMARTAYQINPDIRETYWVLAFVHMERRQHEQALQYLRTAVRLYPSFADGYALMGGIDTYIGRPADTLPLLRTAMRLDPEAGDLYFLLLGRAYLFLGDLEQARVNLEHALARNPVNLEAHVYMAARHVFAGDKAAAAWEAEGIRTLRPVFSSRTWLETYPMTDAAQRTRLVEALGQLAF
jgi:DNA-binding winged helix-turn-helix (wHTH) protein/TolB-like protein/cytochrome c-type biogenesis protein CcmH/NrfG